MPKEDKAEICDPVMLDNSVETALAREFFEEGGWPSEQWWEMFGDPQLNRLIELALEESPTLQKALAKVAEVEQEARKEKAKLFPWINFDFTENWEYLSKNGLYRSFYPVITGAPPIPHTLDQIDLGLNFNWEVDFFGKNRKMFQAALGMARAERAEAKQATLMLTTLIAQTYVEIQTKMAQRQVIQDRLDQRNMLFDLTDARSEHGLDPATPVLQKEQSVYEVEEALITIDKEIALDRHMLNILVGVGPDEEITPQPMNALFEKPFPLPENLSTDLLARRPDLEAQIWRVESAAKEIGAAKADFYPRVNLFAYAQLESLAYSNLLKMSSKQGGLAPAVHLPIFMGGKLRANLKSKVAAFNEAAYRYNEMVLFAAQEVADQIVTLTATYDGLARQIGALESAIDQVELQNWRYENAIDDFLTVLEMQENMLTQRYQLFGYERDYLLAVVKLVKALGGGYQ
ncbi:MAG: efflux transporter outer membrane subunit [Candidatus Melainabacteria bacterium]|nr:efflux transporter outer membrane subunit [Candidatus Melainabacteria bacterium]